MELDKYIESTIKGILKNPITQVLSEIGIAKILKQSNFLKREVGYAPYLVLLHFIYILVMHKRQSTFIKQSPDAFGKDVYYRFIKQTRFNWRKLLLKCGKQIEGSCRYIWSNKEKRTINGINIVSLNYADNYSTFQIDFAVRMNKSRRKEPSGFASNLHHRSNAFFRRNEGLQGKNILALEMVERALKHGIYADFLYRYFDTVVEHRHLGKVRLLFMHTGKELLVFISTDLSLSSKAMIETYKKRWSIEQGYKVLREHFGLGKEENRIYEALIARITLSMFTYNIVNYINRINHEPQTLGELFRELECELETLVISMHIFLQILTKIAEIENVVKENKDLRTIVAILGTYTQKELGFMCES